MKRNTFIIILALLVIACVKKNDTKRVTKCTRSSNDIEYTLDSVIIDLDSVSKPYYFGKINLLETASELIFLAYNSKLNTIDWFDLNRKTITHTPLNVDGPDAIREVNAIYAISKDSVIIASYNNFYIVNQQGKVVSKIGTSIENQEGKKGHLSSSVNIDMYFDKINRYIYTGVNYINNEDNKSQPRAIKYSINTSKYTFLPVYYTAEYIDKYNQLGYTYNFSMSFYRNMLVYNFDYSSDFYIYRYQEDDSEQILSLNNMAEKKFEFSKLNPSEHEKMNLYVSNPMFNLPIMSNNNFLRLSWTGESPTLGVNGKRIILAKYEQDFSTYSETELDNKIHYIGSEMPIKNGFVIIAQHSGTPNIDFEKIKFHIFRFK